MLSLVVSLAELFIGCLVVCLFVCLSVSLVVCLSVGVCCLCCLFACCSKQDKDCMLFVFVLFLSWMFYQPSVALPNENASVLLDALQQGLQ